MRQRPTRSTYLAVAIASIPALLAGALALAFRHGYLVPEKNTALAGLYYYLALPGVELAEGIGHAPVLFSTHRYGWTYWSQWWILVVGNLIAWLVIVIIVRSLVRRWSLRTKPDF